MKMTKRKEEPVRPESKAGREVRVMSAMVRAGDALYRGVLALSVAEGQGEVAGTVALYRRVEWWWNKWNP